MIMPNAEKLQSFYNDFLALLDRSINPFTMESPSDDYRYIKAMPYPYADGITHPDLFANIQLNISANKTDKVYLKRDEIRKMDLLCIGDPILNGSMDCPNVSSVQQSLPETGKYLEKLYSNIRNKPSFNDNRSELFIAISKELDAYIDDKLKVKDSSEFIALKEEIEKAKGAISSDPESCTQIASNALIKYNLLSAMIIANQTLSSLPIDFSKLKENEEDAEKLRLLTIVILAYSLINDSFYTERAAMPITIALESYLMFFPAVFKDVENLRKLFTDDFNFPAWYGVLHSAESFAHLNDEKSEEHSIREEIIENVTKIHELDRENTVFKYPPRRDIDVPTIAILNSFLSDLKDGTVMSLGEAAESFKAIHEHLNKENVEHRTDARISFSISYDRDGTREAITIPESSAMDLCREFRIPQHVALLVSNGVVGDPGLPAFLSKHIGISLLEKKIRQEVIPFIEVKEVRYDFSRYIQAYITSSRRLLNQHHDIDINAPLDVKNYRTGKASRTSRREPKPNADAKKENDPHKAAARNRTKQERRKRRLR